LAKVELSSYSAMIIVRLRGGLGNQLFQYAAGAALANHHRVEYKLDLYYYTKHPYRKFELNKLNIPFTMASRNEVHRYTGSNAVSRYLSKRENYLHCPGVCAQPHYHFYEDFFNLPADIYLSGYWQSERYFHTLRSKITDWYTPVDKLDQQNQDLVNRMEKGASVSLHVRRGDYSGNSIFGVLPLSYYTQAIDTIKQREPQPEFFIFSDDIDWCKKNLALNNAVFVDHNKGENSFRDLLLMSHCRHHIIANSTFSWWGAWLNTDPAKLVIAPRIWFASAYNTNPATVYPSRIYNTKDLIPERWMRL
jgi:hypothetical protein